MLTCLINCLAYMTAQQVRSPIYSGKVKINVDKKQVSGHKKRPMGHFGFPTGRYWFCAYWRRLPVDNAAVGIQEFIFVEALFILVHGTVAHTHA